MKKLLFTVGILSIFWSCDQSSTSTGKTVAKLETEAQKAAYGHGLTIGNQVERMKASPFFQKDSMDLDQVKKGLKDYFSNQDKTKVSYLYGMSIAQGIESMVEQSKLGDDFDLDLVMQAMFNKINGDSLLIPEDSARIYLSNYQNKIKDIIKAENLEKSKKYLEDLKKKDNIKSTESGLLYEVLKEGDGEMPKKDTDEIKMTYEGKLMDGTVFDSTEKQGGQPTESPVNRFVPGFTEGLKLMKVGAKYRLYIPAEIGYGENGNPRANIPPNEVIIFDVELLEVKEGKEPEAKPAIPNNQPQLKPAK